MGKDKFAKLFERDGEQVLVRKEDLDGDPTVFVTFDIEGHLATLNFSFNDAHDGYEARDAVFATIDEDAAFEIVKQAGGRLKGMAER